jgi:hypothetical protein
VDNLYTNLWDDFELFFVMTEVDSLDGKLGG